jgi:hypothetical protein
MSIQASKHAWIIVGLCLTTVAGVLLAQESGKKPSRYAPVAVHEESASIMARMKAAKPREEIRSREGSLLGVCQ